jgi:CubicO group peptidase (beta-lactamase class C family)
MIPTRSHSSTANPTTPVHQPSSRIFGSILGGLAILAVLAGGLYIAAPAADPAPLPGAAKPVPAASGDLDDSGDLERFLDETIAGQIADHEVPGATVSVVKDGNLLFAKGYGVANIEESRPVVASETLFRIGSVTKLFT